jgi:hypothetical protein
MVIKGCTGVDFNGLPLHAFSLYKPCSDARCVDTSEGSPPQLQSVAQSNPTS